MRRDEDYHEADQANQVKVVQIQRLIQEKNIGEAHEEENDADTVPETEGDADRQYPEREEVQVHTVPRPRLHPTKPVVRKVIGGIYIVSLDETIVELNPHLPEHEYTESDAEEDEGGNIDRREEAPQEHAANNRERSTRPASCSLGRGLSLDGAPPYTVLEGLHESVRAILARENCASPYVIVKTVCVNFFLTRTLPNGILTDLC